MFETNIAVVGNVLTAPEWRRTTSNNQLVANFRIASTARRFDRDNNRWIDGDVLRIRVTAWRRLAEGVAASVTVGDPVVVYGRIFTRDWVDDDNKNRVSYEMEALAVGHDLARGRARFYRPKPVLSSTIEGPDTDGLVRGEPTEPVHGGTPAEFGEGLPDEPAPTFLEVVAGIIDEAAETVGAESTAAAEISEPAVPSEALATAGPTGTTGTTGTAGPLGTAGPTGTARPGGAAGLTEGAAGTRRDGETAGARRDGEISGKRREQETGGTRREPIAA